MIISASKPSGIKWITADDYFYRLKESKFMSALPTDSAWLLSESITIIKKKSYFMLLINKVSLKWAADLTIVFVGHLLTAGEIQTHQSAQTQEHGEVQHQQEVLWHTERLKTPPKTLSNQHHLPQSHSCVCVCVCVEACVTAESDVLRLCEFIVMSTDSTSLATVLENQQLQRSPQRLKHTLSHTHTTWSEQTGP